MTDWQPDRLLLTALHDAALAGDSDAYLRALLDACVVMPGGPAAGRWAAARTSAGVCVVVFSSVRALRESPVDAEPYVVWPVADLLYAWPDVTWSLLVDSGLPTEVLLEADAVAQFAADAARSRPVDAALWAAGGDPQAYLNALAVAEVVVPLHPAGSPSRDLSDPEFAWWREAGGAAIAMFTSPARLQARLGDTQWLIVAFVDVLRHWPPGCAALIDPDHHLGVRLPAEEMTAMADAVRLGTPTGE